MSTATASGFDSRAFRNTLSTFTTGVTIITTRSPEGEPIGITANSFNAVSLDPPLVLWSLAKTARSLPAYTSSKHWAVHILAASQQDLSDRFARSGENKFDGVAVETGLGEVPLLSGCTSLLQCETVHCYEGGDHLIFVGRVLDFRRSDNPPLVFQAGKYAVATRKSEQVASSAGEQSAWTEEHLGYLLGRAYFQFYQRVRDSLHQHDLTDTEYFVLTSLMAKDGRSMDELNAIFAYTGYVARPSDFDNLRRRDLIAMQAAPLDGEPAPVTLTQRGRALTLELIAASKAVESAALDAMGQWDALSLRNLLRQFIHATDTGVADPWK